MPVLCVACVRVCYVDRRKGEEAYIPALPRRDGGRIIMGRMGWEGFIYFATILHHTYTLSLSRPRSLARWRLHKIFVHHSVTSSYPSSGPIDSQQDSQRYSQIERKTDPALHYTGLRSYSPRKPVSGGSRDPQYHTIPHLTSYTSTSTSTTYNKPTTKLML